MTTRRRQKTTPKTEVKKVEEQQPEQQDLVTKGLFLRSKENADDLKGITRGEVEVPQRSVVRIPTEEDNSETTQNSGGSKPSKKDIEGTTNKRKKPQSITDMENLSPDDFEKMLLGTMPNSFRRGQFVSGKITRVINQSAFVDIGGKSEGILLETHANTKDIPFQIGQEIEAFILSLRNNEILLANQIQNGGYEELKMAYELKRTVELKIINANKGGFVLKGFDSNGFCPFSQFDFSPPKDPKSLIGTNFDFRITRLGDEFSASRRILLEEEEEKVRTQKLATIQIGDTVEGLVKSIHPFGAFVDIGGIQALCPKRFFNRVQGGIQEGLNLVLEIDNIDAEGKVSVRPQFQDPWLTAAEKYTIGQKYSGTIRTRTDFGFFIALEFGLEGLAHKEQNVSLWSKQPEVGAQVDLYISKMDVENKRLSLSSNPPPQYSTEANRGRMIKEDVEEPTFGKLLEEARRRSERQKKKKKK
jgi:small subunit ribosomal protein S1